jgi:hypothetical protein
VSSDVPWPGHFALLPVLGAYLIIVSNQQSSLITRNFFFQYLGKWSYSIYLWHWPVVVVGYYLGVQNWALYGLTLSVFLGGVSFTFIEGIKLKPFSSWFDLLKIKPVYMSFILCIISSVIFMNEGVKSKYRSASNSPQTQFLDLYKEKHNNLDEAYWLKCNSYTSLKEKGNLSISPDCTNKKDKDGGVFLWGDSHAEALSLGIREILDPLDIPFYQKTSAGCRASLYPTDRLVGIFKEACDSSNSLAIESINNIKPDIVVIAQQGEHEKTEWKEIYEKLSVLGVSHVVLVGPVSQWVPSLPRVMIKPINWNSDNEYINDSGINYQVIESDNIMKSKELPDGLTYVSLIDDLCFIDAGKTFCRVYDSSGDKRLLQVDYGHLSQSGSKFVVNRFLAQYLLN